MSTNLAIGSGPAWSGQGAAPRSGLTALTAAGSVVRASDPGDMHGESDEDFQRGLEAPPAPVKASRPVGSRRAARLRDASSRSRLQLGVVGEGVCSRRVAGLAERVGREIAAAGAVLFCGGLTGVMEAAARGAATTGGVVVGLLPGFARADANPWVTIPIVTGMDQARNVVLVRSCDAVIAVGGMYGTLSEIALALKLGIPVVGLRTWRVRQPDGHRVPVLVASTPASAVALALRAARRRGAAASTWLV